MLNKDVIRLADTSTPWVISGYFARPKKAKVKFRPIVSLKYTNSIITYRKFRTTTTIEVVRWVRRSYYLTSLDLLDA